MVEIVIWIKLETGSDLCLQILVYESTEINLKMVMLRNPNVFEKKFIQKSEQTYDFSEEMVYVTKPKDPNWAS